MMTLLRYLFRALSLSAILLLAACQPLTTATAPVGGAAAPLGATSSEDNNKEETPSLPPAAAPVPPPPSVGGESTGIGPAGGGTTGPTIARESGGGVIGSPSGPERLWEPEELPCNVRIVRLPPGGPVWRNVGQLKAKLLMDPDLIGDDILAGATSRCDYRTILDFLLPAHGLLTEDQVKHIFPDLASGYYYLFFRSLTRPFERDVTMDGKPIASMEELGALLFDRNAELIGQILVDSTITPTSPARPRGVPSSASPTMTSPTVLDRGVR